MTYEELKIQLDISDPCEVLKSAGRQYGTKWFIVYDNGDCHLFTRNGHEIDIKQLDAIKDYAFYWCTSLKSIKIPSNVKSIGKFAFYKCKSLESIIIPASVQLIGTDAFISCSRLKKVVFTGKTMEQVREMNEYPWGIDDISIIMCSLS